MRVGEQAVVQEMLLEAAWRCQTADTEEGLRGTQARKEEEERRDVSCQEGTEGEQGRSQEDEAGDEEGKQVGVRFRPETKKDYCTCRYS